MARPPSRGSRRHRRNGNARCMRCSAARRAASDIQASRQGLTRSARGPPSKKLTPANCLFSLVLWRRFSIHVQPKSLDKHELQRATEAFPLSIEGCSDCYHCGFHAESSYGAASYFIKRANGGNVLMDSPRWSPTLAKRMRALGGVKYLVLSHQDDVAGAVLLRLDPGHVLPVIAAGVLSIF